MLYWLAVDSQLFYQVSRRFYIFFGRSGSSTQWWPQVQHIVCEQARLHRWAFSSRYCLWHRSCPSAVLTHGSKTVVYLYPSCCLFFTSWLQPSMKILTCVLVCVSACRSVWCVGRKLPSGKTGTDGFRIRASEQSQPATRLLLHLRYWPTVCYASAPATVRLKLCTNVHSDVNSLEFGGQRSRSLRPES